MFKYGYTYNEPKFVRLVVKKEFTTYEFLKL